MLDKLYQNSAKIINEVELSFKRYLFDEIDWTNRLIGIKGARGTGKTTLMLQFLKENKLSADKALYVSLDHLYFTVNKLTDLIEHFVQHDGEYLFLDEVHKYNTWSQEIKMAYDSYKNLKIVFTSSSILQLNKSHADLSRRAVFYNLAGLSLREYLELAHNIKLPLLELEDILTDHITIALDFQQKFKPVKIFNEYLKYGYYPFFKENEATYLQRLETVVNLIIDVDLPYIEKIDHSSILKFKKLLYIIATNVPFKLNAQKLSDRTSIHRNNIWKFVDQLNKAQLLKSVTAGHFGLNNIGRPDKLYLDNTNLMFALAEEFADVGTLRETFFANQLSKMHQLSSTDKGDFKVDKNYIFEIGGKNKTNYQVANIKNAYIAADDIETGVLNKIPLWLFGFLY
ncbi:MAG: AAA family ATPase [Bacteroidia bacterium]